MSGVRKWRLDLSGTVWCRHVPIIPTTTVRPHTPNCTKHVYSTRLPCCTLTPSQNICVQLEPHSFSALTLHFSNNVNTCTKWTNQNSFLERIQFMQRQYPTIWEFIWAEWHNFIHYYYICALHVVYAAQIITQPKKSVTQQNQLRTWKTLFLILPDTSFFHSSHHLSRRYSLA